MSTRNTVNNPPAQPSVAAVADLWNAAGSPNTAPELQVGDTCFVAGTVNALYVCTSAGVGTATWILGGDPTLAALATVSAASATLTSAHETAVTYSGGTCALTAPADVTVWPVGVTKRVRKQNTSVNTITLAPNAGGTVNGLGVGVALTLPGSLRVSGTTFPDLWWDVTRSATNTWNVAGGNVRYDSTGDVAVGGALSAFSFAATQNGSAAAPTVRPGTDADTGLYYDATKGLVSAVDGVDRFMLRQSGTGEFATGQASTVPILKLGNTGTYAQLFARFATPEGAITGNPGDVCMGTNGQIFLKTSGTGTNTGWREVSPSVSGTWTPTATGVTNIDAVTGSAGIYLRVGDTVYFSAVFSVDTTSAAAFTFRAIVPITSNFAAVTDCIGTGTTNGNLTARVTADTTNDAIQVDGISTGTTAINYAVSGSYRVI